jgi:phosphoinositide-3-kinase regulatory subunit 4
MAVHTLTQTLAKVNSFAQRDAHILPEYILPALSRVPSDLHELVRVAYAQCVASLAESARRFLDIQYCKAPEDRKVEANAKGTEIGGTPEESYDTELSSLRKTVLELVISMLTIGGSKVKRCLLTDITRLCIFMGRRLVNDALLLHLITVLNDRDWQLKWQLRAAFLEHIVGVSVFVGRESFQACILPCIEQALFDPQAFVIQAGVHALTACCELGLFETRVLLEVTPKVLPTLLHPSCWLRSATMTFVVAAAKQLGMAKASCLLAPLLEPFLRSPLVVITLPRLAHCLKEAISRREFDATMQRCEEIGAPPVNQESHKLSKAGRDLTVTARMQALSDEDIQDEGVSEKASEIEARLGEDVSLRPVFEYIRRAAEQRRVMRETIAMDKNTGASNRASLGEEGAEEDDEYAKLDGVVLYGVEVPRTMVEAAASTSLDRAQADAYESLGVKADGERPGHRRDLTNPAQLNKNRVPPMPGSKAVPKRRPSGTPLTNVQSQEQLGDYARRALSIPPNPSNLGVLRPDTISNTSFYRNHHRLETGQLDSEPVEWTPKGTLVARLTEHRQAVNELSVSRDNLFFVTASDDGTVKVWDCTRLQATARAQSHLSYSQGGRVTSVAVCDSSHSVCSASTNGSVHVFKVEVAGLSSKEDSPRYVGLTDIKRIDKEEGAVLQIAHFNTLTESMLAFATQRGGVHGWDLRAREDSFRLQMESPAMGKCF